MPVHRSHGRPMPQAPRPDELPQGVPDPMPVPTGPTERGPDGRFKAGNRVARAGGKAKRQRVEHLHRLGLDWLAAPPKDPSDPRQVVVHERWAEHRKQAARQLKAEQAWLARTTGGGVLDPSAASELRSAIELEALGRLLLQTPSFIGQSVGDTLALAQRLLTAARGHRLTAYELSARGAQARQQTAAGGGAARLFADLDTEAVERQYRELLGQVQTEEGGKDDDE